MKIFNSIKINIDWQTLRKSFLDDLYIIGITLIPLIITLLFLYTYTNNIDIVINKATEFSEIILISTSFLAPVLVFFGRQLNHDYKFPFAQGIFYATILLYCFLLLNIFVIKTNTVPNYTSLAAENHKLSFSILIITLILRVISTYHQSRRTNLFTNKIKEQNDFNLEFKKSIDGESNN